ncbi:Phage integrase family protein [Pseudomonas citronellolis]|uniref:Phage integrase family protein n=1 Tax=Pseudomonas citronellolis TaxID=53408 RepID=A0AAQ1KJ66_9PSED|nr:site-specific integrase [Pseudomonas citronellolis]TGC32445.1 site-specific integrase [Pseudomonas citronellolis]SFD52906.1 Phage integrase family protein [Pseudomonas citronellolis]
MGTIVKRGEKWRAVVRMKGHPTSTKTFAKRAEAKVWIAEIENAMHKRELAHTKDEISDLVQKYVDEILPLRKNLKQSRNNYLTLKRLTKGLTLGDLNATDLLKWVQEKRSAASKATRLMDLTMINTVLKAAEAFWSLVIPWKEFKKARVALRSLGLVGKSRERDRRPEGDELDRIKAELSTVLPLDDLIDFAIATTMRSSEVTRLRWADLNEKNRTIIIRDRKHPNEKVGNDQVVPLLNGAFEIVMRQPRAEGQELIFPYKSKSVEAAFQRARGRAGVIDLRYHDLRHHGISLLFEMGFAIQEVAIVSGHKDWNQLRRYTNLKPESLHEGPIAFRILREREKALEQAEAARAEAVAA